MSDLDIGNVYKKHFSSLVCYAKTRIDSIEDAEDIVQDAFLKQLQYFEDKELDVCENVFLEYIKNTIKQLCVNLQKKHTL